MNDKDIDRMVDRHAELIGAQLEAPRESIGQALERWRDGRPRLVTESWARETLRTMAFDTCRDDPQRKLTAAQRHTAKRRRQRQRARARKAKGL